MNRTLLILFFLLGTLARSRATEWKTYTDYVVGYSITYPGFLNLAPWKGDPAGPGQWRTKSFRSNDGKVELYVETHSIAEENETQKLLSAILEKYFNQKLTARTNGGDHIGYALAKNNWYVISGVNSKGYEFYEKFFVFPAGPGEDSSWYIYFDFIYPHGQRPIYDPLVGKIVHEFIPNLPGKNHEH